VLETGTAAVGFGFEMLWILETKSSREEPIAGFAVLTVLFLPFLVKKVILGFESPTELRALDEVVVVEMTELRLPID
jgi:hypothetical protein